MQVFQVQGKLGKGKKMISSKVEKETSLWLNWLNSMKKLQHIDITKKITSLGGRENSGEKAQLSNKIGGHKIILLLLI